MKRHIAKRDIAIACGGLLLSACLAAGDGASSTDAASESVEAAAPELVAAPLELERPLVRYYEIADT